MKLSADQAQALRELHQFVESGRAAHALSGPAGTGKTFLVGRFLEQLSRKYKLAATTNKAAGVAARLSAGAEASTIHSLLGLQPSEDHHRGRLVLKRVRKPKVKAGEVIIVDEASMIDSELLSVINDDAARIGFRALFVGDAYQLPPVFEAVSPAFDKVPTSRLTTVHRQALDNPLIEAATAFRNVLDGAAFPVIAPGMRGLRKLDASRFEAEMLEEFVAAPYQADEDYARAIAWTNARVVELNHMIRRALIGPDAERWPYLPGETVIASDAIVDDDAVLVPTEARVIVISSEPDAIQSLDIVVPGDRVVIEYKGDAFEVFCPSDRRAAKAAQDQFAKAARALQTEFDRTGDLKVDGMRRAAWRTFFALKRSMADLRPPHASTVHKSQGSTYGRVFIDVGDIGRCTRADVIARLAYVALTRASIDATVMGELPARLYQQREAA